MTGFALPGLLNENLELLPLTHSKSTGQASVSSRAKILGLGKLCALALSHFSFFCSVLLVRPCIDQKFGFNDVSSIEPNSFPGVAGRLVQ
jgi:hypothetical protein